MVGWIIARRPLGFALTFLMGVLIVLCARPADASTSAGTAIVNVGTYSYTGTGSVTFTGQSNTLTVYVQNAPVMTITNPSGQNVTPAMVAVSTFTLTNTGNNTSGTFALTGTATFGGTATGTTLNGFVLNGAASGTCSVATPCTYTTLNAQAGMVTSGSTVTVGVEYTVSASATSGQTIQPSITANITYAAGTGTSSNTSSNVTNTTYSDTLIVDARLDVQAAATIPGSGGANITWTITANNGGGSTAQGLASAKTVFGAANNGIAIFVPMPSFNATYLTLQAQPSAPTLSGQSAGATAAVYYNATPCSSHPTTGWSTTYSSTAECLAVYVSNSSASVLPSATGGSSGAGSVTTAQITFSFATNQPSGNGSGNANSVTLVASSAVGGVTWATSAVPIVGQGLTLGSTTDAATATLLNSIQTNVTSSSGTTPPGGASNQAGSHAYTTYVIYVGPSGSATATGAWSAATVPGYTTGTADNSHDFTFLDYDNGATATNANGTVGSGPSGNTIANGGAVSIVNTAQNSGNGTDSIVLSASTVTNWTVTFQCYNTGANVCGGGDSAGTCHVGNLASNTISSLAAGSTYSFCATFTPSSTVTAFSPVAWTITGTSSGSGAVSNTTYDAVYPGGEIVVFRSYAVSACPGGVTPANNGAITGCTITYTVTVVNEAPSATAGSGSGNATVTPGSSITMTENGATGGNTWAANSNGLTGAPTLTGCTSCTTTGATSSTNFTVTIPSSDLAPQGSATFSYAIVVK